MTLYCEIDLHSNSSVVAVQDEQDRTVYEKRLPNDPYYHPGQKKAGFPPPLFALYMH